MKRILFIIAFVVAGFSTLAQDSFSSLHYDISVPLSNTQDYIGQGSWRGVGFDYRNKVMGNLAVGFSLGWHVFYEQKDFDTYTEGNLSLSGVQFRYINSFPMHANATYYLGTEDANFQPYVGVGIGTTSFNMRTEMGLFQSNTNSWNFSMQPEAGFLYRINYNVAVLAGAKYHTIFKNSKVDAQGYLTFNVGLAWTID